MKRILSMTVMAAVMAGSVTAQTVKKTKEFITANDWVKAKEAIELTFNNPKLKKDDQPEAWYLKAKIYSAFATTAELKANAPADARSVALESIKKAIELDKNQAQVFLTMDQYGPVFNLYTSSFEDGAAKYNEAKYDEALDEFKKAAVTGEFIFSQGWGLYKLDTTLTYYSALAALNAKKEDEAVALFSKLADARVASNPDQATSYRYLAKYYFDKKDEVNMNKYILLGKELYPNDDYLPLLELDFVRDKGDRVALFAKFEEMITTNPNNFDVMFEYANELFGETHVSDIKLKPVNYDQNCVKIEELYTKAAAIKPENYDVLLSLGKHFYNMALFKDEESRSIKSNKPEDQKKKADMKTEVIALATKTIDPLEKVFNHYDSEEKLKTHDRSNYKSAISLLQFAYEQKGDKAKSDFYQKKYDDADKKQ